VITRKAKPLAQAVPQPRYSIAGPVPVGGGTGQQIRVLVGGSTGIAGSVDIVRDTPGQAIITNLFVSPEHRRNGIGRRLMEAAIQRVRAQGFHEARLEARPMDGSIEPAALVGMYRQFGFQQGGRSPSGSATMRRVLSTPMTHPVPSIQRKASVPISYAPLKQRVETIQRAQHSYTFGFSSSRMEPSQWSNSGESTYLSLMFQPDGGTSTPISFGITKSNKSVTHGSEHAEDVALRMITDNITLFDQNSRNSLILNISKSPCTSTVRMGAYGAPLPVTSTKVMGCAEELINLVTNGITQLGSTYNFKLHVICRGLYVPKVAGATQDSVLDASQAAVNAMKATGHITVTGDERPSNKVNRFEVN
jgi:GNAT superfamily N-acetyltransferase